MANTNVVPLLNKQLANWGVLYVKLHHLHWYVKGTDFFTLHEKFEELYDKAAEYMDELAERALAIQGRPLSTMRQFLENSSIQEATGEETAEESVQSLLRDLEIIIPETYNAMKQAQQLDDEGTADLLLGIAKEMEKQAWFFRTYLENRHAQSQTTTGPRHIYYGNNPNVGAQR